MTHPTHWAASARPGDIAMFRFPLGESEAEPKARPCLIIPPAPRAPRLASPSPMAPARRPTRTAGTI